MVMIDGMKPTGRSVTATAPHAAQEALAKQTLEGAGHPYGISKKAKEEKDDIDENHAIGDPETCQQAGAQDRAICIHLMQGSEDHLMPYPKYTYGQHQNIKSFVQQNRYKNDCCTSADRYFFFDKHEDRYSHTSDD